MTDDRQLASQALTVLRRVSRLNDDEAAMTWATGIADAELLRFRNLGPRRLAWIRSHAPDTARIAARLKRYVG